MEITEVRVKLAGDRDDKLRAFCTVTFDNCFVVRDIKIIRGTRGSFVAMPSRKLSDTCPRCRGKNHLRARFCNECGNGLSPNRADRDDKGRAKLHADIAHPIHREFRAYLQGIILRAFNEETERAKQPGYRPPSDDFFDDDATIAGESGGHGAAPPSSSIDPQTDHRFGEGIAP